MISGTAELSGRIKFTPLVAGVDQSSNPAWLSDVLEALACSAHKSEEFTLTSDGAVPVSFGSLSGASLIVVKVVPNVGAPPTIGFPNGVPASPNPVTVSLTGAAGTAPLTIDGFMALLSTSAPYTAMTVARAAGVQTTVRIQLYQFGS